MADESRIEIDTPRITIDFREFTELVLKRQGIHEGIWGFYARFGLTAMNVNVAAPEEGAEAVLTPSAIVPLLEIGIQRFKEESHLSIDASVVNPKTSNRKTAKKRATKRAKKSR